MAVTGSPDVLSDVLRWARLRGVVQGRLDLSAPWGFAVPAGEAAVFYLVASGSCWIEIEGDELGDAPRRVEAGDLIFLPRAPRHVLKDAPRTRALSISALAEGCDKPGPHAHVRAGGGGVLTKIMAGRFEMEGPAARRLQDALPAIIIVPASAGLGRGLAVAPEEVCEEIETPGPGSVVLIDRLADVLLVRVLRHYMATAADAASTGHVGAPAAPLARDTPGKTAGGAQPHAPAHQSHGADASDSGHSRRARGATRVADAASKADAPVAAEARGESEAADGAGGSGEPCTEPRRRNWLTALVDPRIGRALSAMHGRPERPWTVTTLAREAGESRSGFATRFKTAVGESPMEYLARWRVELGADLLVREELTVGEAAARVGYETDAAFTRVFKRQFGTPPARYRRLRAGAAASSGARGTSSRGTMAHSDR